MASIKRVWGVVQSLSYSKSRQGEKRSGRVVSFFGRQTFMLEKPTESSSSSRNEGVRMVRCSWRQKMKFSSRPPRLFLLTGKSENQAEFPSTNLRIAFSP